MKKEELYTIQFLSNIQYRLVDCIFGNNLHYVIQSSAICMDVEVDRHGKLQDEETGLYKESSAYVYDLFKDEMNFGHIIQAEI